MSLRKLKEQMKDIVYKNAFNGLTRYTLHDEKYMLVAEQYTLEMQHKSNGKICVSFPLNTSTDLVFKSVEEFDAFCKTHKFYDVRVVDKHLNTNVFLCFSIICISDFFGEKVCFESYYRNAINRGSNTKLQALCRLENKKQTYSCLHSGNRIFNNGEVYLYVSDDNNDFLTIHFKNMNIDSEGAFAFCNPSQIEFSLRRGNIVTILTKQGFIDVLKRNPQSKQLKKIREIYFALITNFKKMNKKQIGIVNRVFGKTFYDTVSKPLINEDNIIVYRRAVICNVVPFVVRTKKLDRKYNKRKIINKAIMCKLRNFLFYEQHKDSYSRFDCEYGFVLYNRHEDFFFVNTVFGVIPTDSETYNDLQCDDYMEQKNNLIHAYKKRMLVMEKLGANPY